MRSRENAMLSPTTAKAEQMQPWGASLAGYGGGRVKVCSNCEGARVRNLADPPVPKTIGFAGVVFDLRLSGIALGNGNFFFLI